VYTVEMENARGENIAWDGNGNKWNLAWRLYM
jgi:hypothetical protein